MNKVGTENTVTSSIGRNRESVGISLGRLVPYRGKENVETWNYTMYNLYIDCREVKA